MNENLVIYGAKSNITVYADDSADVINAAVLDGVYVQGDDTETGEGQNGTEGENGTEENGEKGADGDSNAPQSGDDAQGEAEHAENLKVAKNAVSQAKRNLSLWLNKLKEAEEAEVKDEKRIAEAQAKVKDAEALLAEATEALTKLEA